MTTDTPAEFNVRLDRLVKEYNEQSAWQRRVGRMIAKDVGDYATRAASRDLGGDPKFSGWAPTLDTKSTFSDGATIFSPTRRSAGPWTVAEDGRNQSTSMSVTPNFGQSRGTSRISAKTGKVVRGRARKARRWNGRTEGKGTATTVVNYARKKAPAIFQRESEKLTKSIF
jgi:hypothetical protein